MKLKDKVAVVTGAGSGIGEAIGRLFAAEGATVIVCDIIPETAQKVSSAIGGNSIAFKVDVASSKEVDDTVKQVIEKFGRIDVLVNNAGITKDTLLLRMTDDDWERVLKVNLTGTFFFTRAAIRHMMKARSGRIINVSSIVGIIGNAGQANYAASKAGIIAFTKSCAKELASRNIMVNAIAPGFIQTALTEKLPEEIKTSYLKTIPLGRFGEPKDVAKVAVFLASDEAAYVTGQVICVDGGMVM